MTSGVGMLASIGYGNYNALFITLKSQDWHGLTMQSNFTWSKALGTGAEVQAISSGTPPDPFNLQTGYGYQAFDRRFVYNVFFVYQPHWHDSQSGFLGHFAGGWTLPLFLPPAADCRSPLARLMEAVRRLAKATRRTSLDTGYRRMQYLCHPRQPGTRLTSFCEW